MKKFGLLLILFFNIIPYISRTGIEVFNPLVAAAQSWGSEAGATNIGAYDSEILPEPGDVGDMQEYAGSCVFANMEIVAAMFGEDMAESSLLSSYAAAAGVTVSHAQTYGFEGPTMSSLNSYVGQYFEYEPATTATDMYNSIDNGLPVMGFKVNSIITNSDGTKTMDGHQITITGYNSDTGKLSYYNTEYGTYQDVDPSNVYSGISITAVKH